MLVCAQDGEEKEEEPVEEDEEEEEIIELAPKELKLRVMHLEKALSLLLIRTGPKNAQNTQTTNQNHSKTIPKRS